MKENQSSPYAELTKKECKQRFQEISNKPWSKRNEEENHFHTWYQDRITKTKSIIKRLIITSLAVGVPLTAGIYGIKTAIDKQNEPFFDTPELEEIISGSQYQQDKYNCYDPLTAKEYVAFTEVKAAPRKFLQEKFGPNIPEEAIQMKSKINSIHLSNDKLYVYFEAGKAVTGLNVIGTYHVVLQYDISENLINDIEKVCSDNTDRYAQQVVLNYVMENYEPKVLGEFVGNLAPTKYYPIVFKVENNKIHIYAFAKQESGLYHLKKPLTSDIEFINNIPIIPNRSSLFYFEYADVIDNIFLFEKLSTGWSRESNHYDGPVNPNTFEIQDYTPQPSN